MSLTPGLKSKRDTGVLGVESAGAKGAEELLTDAQVETIAERQVDVSAVPLLVGATTGVITGTIVAGP